MANVDSEYLLRYSLLSVPIIYLLHRLAKYINNFFSFWTNTYTTYNYTYHSPTESWVICCFRSCHFWLLTVCCYKGLYVGLLKYAPIRVDQLNACRSPQNTGQLPVCTCVMQWEKEGSLPGYSVLLTSHSSMGLRLQPSMLPSWLLPTRLSTLFRDGWKTGQRFQINVWRSVLGNCSAI